MRTQSTVAWLAAAGMSALLAAAQHGEHTPEITPQKAGEMFTGRCVNCHTAPDVSFATDRAWLEQVRDTA